MRSVVASMLGACVVAAILATPVAGREGRARDSKPTQDVVVDINRASAADFEKLPGIGPVLARRIITYRNKHGPFRRAEDLLAIHGMGEKKWRAIRPFLTVESTRDRNGTTK